VCLNAADTYQSVSVGAIQAGWRRPGDQLPYLDTRQANRRHRTGTC